MVVGSRVLVPSALKTDEFAGFITIVRPSGVQRPASNQNNGVDLGTRGKPKDIAVEFAAVRRARATNVQKGWAAIQFEVVGALPCPIQGGGNRGQHGIRDRVTPEEYGWLLRRS